MQLKIHHETRFTYETPPQRGVLQIRVRPRDNAAQTVNDWALELTGARSEVRFVDAFGTEVELIQMEPDQTELSIRVDGQVTTHSNAGIVGKEFGHVRQWFFQRTTPLTHADDAVLEVCDALRLKDRISANERLDALHELSAYIRDKVQYTTGQTNTQTTASDALREGRGVCQDHAHVFLAAARSVGLPARYVSGYLMMNDRVDQDASHAWAECFVPDLGWTGFDISNGISPDERYVKIAHGLDYNDCAPTRGVIVGGLSEDLVVAIQVQQ